MKYCIYCGNEMFDDAVMCVKCGRITEPLNSVNKNKGLKTAIKVFMIIGTIILGIYIIPLAWCLPMTISYFNKVKNGERVSDGFKVCTLLFVSLVSGILMLLDNEN